MSKITDRKELIRELNRLRARYRILDKDRFNAANLREKHNIILLMETTMQELNDVFDELFRSTTLK